MSLKQETIQLGYGYEQQKPLENVFNPLEIEFFSKSVYVTTLGLVPGVEKLCESRLKPEISLQLTPCLPRNVVRPQNLI